MMRPGFRNFAGHVAVTPGDRLSYSGELRRVLGSGGKPLLRASLRAGRALAVAYRSLVPLATTAAGSPTGRGRVRAPVRSLGFAMPCRNVHWTGKCGGTQG